MKLEISSFNDFEFIHTNIYGVVVENTYYQLNYLTNKIIIILR